MWDQISGEVGTVVAMSMPVRINMALSVHACRCGHERACRDDHERACYGCHEHAGLCSGGYEHSAVRVPEGRLEDARVRDVDPDSWQPVLPLTCHNKSHTRVPPTGSMHADCQPVE